MEEYAGAAFSGPILYSNLVALKLWPIHITCVGLGLEHMHVVLCLQLQKQTVPMQTSGPKRFSGRSQNLPKISQNVYHQFLAFFQINRLSEI
jgi:hypothetical protein